MTLDPLVVFGAIGTLLGGVTAAGLTGRWVFGWVYQEKAEEADFWRDKFLTSVGLTDRALDVVEKKVSG